MKWKFHSHHVNGCTLAARFFVNSIKCGKYRKEEEEAKNNNVKWAQRQTQISITFCWSLDDIYNGALVAGTHSLACSLVLSSVASVNVQINNDHNHVQHCDERNKKQQRRRTCDFIFSENGTTLGWCNDHGTLLSN